MKDSTNRPFLLPKRIDALQTLRFFGAMCITFYHFSALQSACPFDFSNAVYLFYIISGFVVMLSTRSPEKKKFFLTRRLIRTLPLYWGLTFATFAAGLVFPSFLGYKPTAEQLIKSLLFIPYARTTAKGSTAIRPLVGLGHTLQMEMLFYILFLIAIHISHKRRGLITAMSAAAVALVGVVFPTKFAPIHFYTANPYVWTSFIIGIAVYFVFSRVQKKRLTLRHAKLPWICAVLASAAAAIPAFLFETNAWYSVFLFTVVFCTGLIYAACGEKSPVILVKLGNVSFSYYLLHYYTVTLGVRFLQIDSFSARNVLLSLLISAGTWCISSVSWLVIEEKLTGFLQKKLLKKNT